MAYILTVKILIDSQEEEAAYEAVYGMLERERYKSCGDLIDYRIENEIETVSERTNKDIADDNYGGDAFD